MHLLTAIREAILQAHRKEIGEYRRINKHVIREVLDGGLRPPGNWEPKCEAEAYSEFPLIPHHYLKIGIECDSYQFHDRDPKQFE